MTENEIIVKAFECCYNDKPCSDCPFYVDCNCTAPKNDTEFLPKKIVEIINRLQADIKRLTSGKCVYLSDEETTEYCVEGPCPNYKTIAQIKAEAYKEFAERLKESKPIEHKGTLYYETFTIREIDNLVKEIVGE